MVYVFPPILFLTITPFLQEGVNLFRSLILFIVCLIYVALHPTILNFKYKIILALMTIPTWYFIGAIVNSLNPILALAGNYNRNFGILTYLSMGLLFLIGANSTLDLERFIRYSVSSLFVLVIVYGYIQVFNLDFLFWAESDRVVLTLGNSNFAASFIAMLITFPIYLYTRAQNFSTKMLYIFITFSAIYLGIKTISFQFRVISIISIIFFILFYKYPLISRYKLWQKVSGLGFLLLSISGYVIGNYDDVISMSNFSDRFSQQKMGFKIFLDHPFFGVGVNNLYSFAPSYLSTRDIRVNGSNTVPDITHNFLVDHLANGGIVVGLAALIFIIYTLFIIFRLMSHLELASSQRLNLAVASAIWVAYVAQLFVNTDSIMMFVVPYLIIGLIIKESNILSVHSKTSSKQFKKIFPQKLLRLSALLVLVPSLLFMGESIKADQKVKQITTNKISTSKNEIITLIKSWPNPKTAELFISLASTNLDNCDFIDAASDELLLINKRSGQAWFAKGICAEHYQNLEVALSYYQNALKFQPINLTYLERKFILELELRQIVASKSTLAKIKFIDPQFLKINELNLMLKNFTN